MALLNLNVFGGFEARLPSGEMLRISGKKGQALLAYLALCGGQPKTRDKIAALLWSDRGNAHARNSLRQVLVALRRDLNEVAAKTLVIDGDVLAIDIAQLDVDAVAAGRLGATDRADDLRELLRLYRGDLLDGIAIPDTAFQEWLDGERSRYRELVIAAIHRGMAKFAGQEAIEIALRLLALDPLREASHHELMRAYVAQGQPDLALRQYQLCCDMLRRELDVEPNAELRALRDTIARGIQQGGRALNLSPDAAQSITVRSSLQRPAIAVLPFSNLSDDKEQQYFSDGITDDIITELARFSSLLVIARNSSFQYRGRDVDVKQVGRELGVQYVVEGSIRRVGEQLRVTAQLVDTTSGGHIWAQRYDRTIDDLFSTQDELVRAVVATTENRVIDTEAELAVRQPPNSWAAHDYYLQARKQMNDYWGYQQAEKPLLQAIELDPAMAEAYAKLTHVWISKFWASVDDRCVQKAAEYARKALSLNPRLSDSHNAMSIAYAFQDQMDLALLHAARAVELNPNDVHATIDHAQWLIYSGKCVEGLAELDLLLKREPIPPVWYWDSRSSGLFPLKRYQEVIDAYSMVHRHQPWELGYIAASLAFLGRAEETIRHRNLLLAASPNMTIARMLRIERHQTDAAKAHFAEGLRRAGLPE